MFGGSLVNFFGREFPGQTSVIVSTRGSSLLNFLRSFIITGEVRDAFVVPEYLRRFFYEIVSGDLNFHAGLFSGLSFLADV